jgi:cell division septal protein FtsQ
MARRRRKAAEEEAAERGTLWRARMVVRFVFLTLTVVAVVFGAGWLLWRGEQFLKYDDRFRLPEADAAEGPSAIEVTGTVKTRPADVEAVFAEDRGRSLMLLDPEARRQSLLQLPWVKDAEVRRVWPNRVSVTLKERTPVAFLLVPLRATGSMEHPLTYQPMLIDEDGVVLGLRGEAPGGLPLLRGVSVTDPRERLRARAQKMMRVLEQLKAWRARITEVDLTEPDNVKVGYDLSGRTVILILGSEKWQDHLAQFERTKEGYADRLVDRAVLDLSMDGRVILKSALPPPKAEEENAEKK